MSIIIKKINYKINNFSSDFDNFLYKMAEILL